MKKIGLRSISLIVLILALAFSLICFFRNQKQRRVFYFSTIGSDTMAVEVRYLPPSPVQGSVGLFVDELLLGPETQRARPLFSPGTKNEFCFVRGKTLYVGLSKEVLYQIPEAENILKGVALFKKNVQKNFSGVKEIFLFIDGKYVE